MHWFKRGIYGMFFALFVFIFLVFLQVLEVSTFDPTFIALGGFMLVILMGFTETSIATW